MTPPIDGEHEQRHQRERVEMESMLRRGDAAVRAHVRRELSEQSDDVAEVTGAHTEQLARMDERNKALIDRVSALEYRVTALEGRSNALESKATTADGARKSWLLSLLGAVGAFFK